MSVFRHCEAQIAEAIFLINEQVCFVTPEMSLFENTFSTGALPLSDFGGVRCLPLLSENVRDDHGYLGLSLWKRDFA